MSSLVMRPLEPVPRIWRRSTLFSFAMRRTRGEERTTTCDGANCATCVGANCGCAATWVEADDAATAGWVEEVAGGEGAGAGGVPVHATTGSTRTAGRSG